MRTVFFFLFLLPFFCAQAQQRFRFSQPKMGSPFTLLFYANDSIQASKLADGAFAMVDSLNVLFSDYLESSELNRLSRTSGTSKAIAVSPQLLAILSRSKVAAQKSSFAFDITIGPLSQLWRKARRENQFPSAAAIKAAKKKVGMQHLQIDTMAQTVVLSKPGMQLDLGGIAKGHVAQEVLAYLSLNGITSALVDAGGDMVCSQAPPGKKGWTVGINLPESATDILAETIELSHCAVATSGDLYQYIEHKGRRYSHIIDPRTGYGVPFQRNVTVIAADGATADWLATACSILPLEQCKKLATKMKADLLITYMEKNGIRYEMTASMKKRLRL